MKMDTCNLLSLKYSVSTVSSITTTLPSAGAITWFPLMVSLREGIRKKETINISNTRLIANTRAQTHNNAPPRNQHKEKFNAPKMSVEIAIDLYPSLCIVIKKN
jgi:hypothetical protein